MPQAYVFYHYLHPDDVVSSVHLSELCSGLVRHGWEVVAFPCNRGCRDEAAAYPAQSSWQGVQLQRIWRPAWKQASSAGRILNAAWMNLRWAAMAARRKHRPDVLIVGTDPILSVLVAPIWKFFHPRTKIAHWCLDLYPEAAYADGLLQRNGWMARGLHWLLRCAYQSCDAIVDIGNCMRSLLLPYAPQATRCTLVPWALAEPDEPLPIANAERTAIFGETRLALMYSGNFGRAHSHETLLSLARALRQDPVQLAFSVRGNRVNALQAEITTEDSNIRFVPFAPADRLQDRLACADIHVVSLREDWTGTVVPSKFFGSLAVGRPVLYCGSAHSAIARWIEELGIGWVLTPANFAETVNALRTYAGSPQQQFDMQARCHAVYCKNFSKDAVLQGWNTLLRELISK